MSFSSRREPGADRRVQVVHLVTTLAIGGLENVVLDLARLRTPEGFETRVICLDEGGVLQNRFDGIGVPTEVIGTAGSVPRRILRLARRLRQLRPDVLHTHNPQAHIHGGLAARLAGVPVVVHTKHGREHVDQPVLEAAGRLASRWTAKFIAVSDDARSIAYEIEGVPARKLRVIHNGIDVDRYAERPPRRALAPRRVVTVGRLDPVKDQASLLQATRRVVDLAPNFRLDIVGDGPCRAELERLRDALGLAGHVCFHGYHGDVGPFLSAADFFVLSSVSEGVSLALLEAMATGLPAVATDVGGNREVVDHGETGYLVPTRAPDLLAAVMLRVQSDVMELERMGRAARRRVEACFNLRNVVAQYESLYLECLRPNGAGTSAKPPALSVKPLGVPQ